MRLEPGQVAVVTGAASGIGRALAVACATRGLHLALADVEGDPLAEVAAAAAAHGVDVIAEVVDVTDRAAVDRLAGAVAERFGAVHLVAANAGVVGPRVPVWEQSDADWEWILGVNVRGVQHVLAAFVPSLVDRGAGHVLVTSSIAGLAPMPGGGNAPYTASKHAVVGLAETLRVELADHAPGVGVTILCPGPVATRIRDAARNRPASLGGPGVGPPPVFTHAVDPLSADAVARACLDAVVADAPYLLPNPEYRELVTDHLRGVADAVGAEPGPPAG